MTDAPYVLGGYALTAVALGGYALRMVVRGRALSRPAPASPVSAADGERRPESP